MIDQGATARAALAAIGAEPAQLADPSVAKALGRRLGVDAIITGAATYYFDDTTISVPQCSNCRNENTRPFRVTHNTTVYTTFQARVVETNKGAIIWSNTVDGREHDPAHRLSQLEGAHPASQLVGARHGSTRHSGDTASRCAGRGPRLHGRPPTPLHLGQEDRLASFLLSKTTEAL